MDKAILQVLEYYSIFKYAPTISEIRAFLRVACRGSRANQEIKKLTDENRIVVQSDRLALRKNKLWITQSGKRAEISEEKIQKSRQIVTQLGKIPWVKFIGISGSVAATNAQQEDDVDLFVITAKNRLWTARFFLTLFAMMLGKRRNRADTEYKDKLCFNLFFSEDDLAVPAAKRNAYVGHEVLQVLPIVNKEKVYEKFLGANSWVGDLFPNAVITRSPVTRQTTKQSGHDIGLFFERILGYLQLRIISRHRTSEIITKTQLWFFPDDFALKIPKRVIYS